MESLSSLLNIAERRGLTIRAGGSTLIVEGPDDMEAVALELLDRKGEVLAYLNGGKKHREPCLVGCGVELEFIDGLSYCVGCQAHQRIEYVKDKKVITLDEWRVAKQGELYG